MPKLAIQAAPPRTGSGDPDPCMARARAKADLQLHRSGGTSRLTHHDGRDRAGPRNLAPKGENE